MEVTDERDTALLHVLCQHYCTVDRSKQGSKSDSTENEKMKRSQFVYSESGKRTGQDILGGFSFAQVKHLFGKLTF